MKITKFLTLKFLFALLIAFSFSACEENGENGKNGDDPTSDASEPNNSRSEASTLTLSQWTSAYVDEEDIDWYSFTVTHEAFDIVLIEAQNLSDELEIELGLYDEDGNEIGSWGGGNGANVNVNFSTVAGTFYIKIISRYSNNAGEYKLKVANTNANDANEPNETSDAAAELGSLPVTNLAGSLVSKYEQDWYTFTTENDGVWDKVSIDIQNNSEELELLFEVYDSEHNKIDEVGGGNGANVNLTLPTKGGTYYLVVKSRYENNKGDYTLTIENQNLNDDNEPDDTFENAREINSFPSGTLSGTIVVDAEGDNGGDYEFFKVTLNEDKKVEFTVDPEASNTEMHFNIYGNDQSYLDNYDGGDGQTINYFVNNTGSSTYFYIKLGAFVGDNGNYTISFTETTAE